MERFYESKVLTLHASNPDSILVTGKSDPLNTKSVVSPKNSSMYL